MSDNVLRKTGRPFSATAPTCDLIDWFWEGAVGDEVSLSSSSYPHEGGRAADQ